MARPHLTKYLISAGDRQAALPHEAGGCLEERGVHPPEPAPPRSCQPGEDVRDPGEDLRRHGEVERFKLGHNFCVFVILALIL